jgi:hypothetical protein
MVSMLSEGSVPASSSNTTSSSSRLALPVYPTYDFETGASLRPQRHGTDHWTRRFCAGAGGVGAAEPKQPMRPAVLKAKSS